VQPSIGIVDPRTGQNVGVSILGAVDFLLILPSNDVYVPAIPDCKFDSLMNDSSDVEDDHVDNCNKALTSSGVCWFRERFTTPARG
jgi:hypothetical protein